MRSHPTTTLIARIKREARRASKAGNASHSAALEAGARAVGYDNWHELLAARDAAAPDFPIDPVLPARFDCTSNECRSASEVARWWDRPFAITNLDGTLTVRCLDGGCWDRSTYYGCVDTIDDARRLAAIRLEKWRQNRMRPIPTYDFFDPELPYALVRQPQRPHDESLVLARFATADDANAALRGMGYTD